MHDRDQVVEDPLPEGIGGIRRWPLRVVWTCVLGLIGITLVTGIVAVVISNLAGGSNEVLLAVSLPLQYGLMYLLVRRISRHHGTGRVADDLSWRIGRRDLWPGVGTTVLALVVTAVVVNSTRSLFGIGEDGGDQFGSLDDTSAARVLLAVAAIIGAPLFEELLFRGVVLHAMLARGRLRAVVGSSLLFGLTHLSPELSGEENLLLLLSTAVTGAVLAWAVLRTGRLGPSMVAHACFNLLVISIVFSTTS